MPQAFCTACGAGYHWQATRGARLADHRCSACGGVLRAAGAERRRSTAGRTMEVCAACLRRRWSVRMVTLMKPEEFVFQGGVMLGAGARVCGTHEVRTGAGFAPIRSVNRTLAPGGTE